jgi:sec-independent protein translocase protein TatB
VDILGIGFAELLFIMVIAMMVFGPRRLPEIASKAGKILRDLRQMSQGLLTEWQRELNAEAYMEELKKTQQELSEIKADLTQAQKSVSRGTSDVVREISNVPKIQPESTPPKPATTPAPAPKVEKDSKNNSENGSPSDGGTAKSSSTPDQGTVGDVAVEPAPKVEPSKPNQTELISPASRAIAQQLAAKEKAAKQSLPQDGQSANEAQAVNDQSD